MKVGGWGWHTCGSASVHNLCLPFPACLSIWDVLNELSAIHQSICNQSGHYSGIVMIALFFGQYTDRLPIRLQVSIY